MKLSSRSALTRVQSFISEISGGLTIVLILAEVQIEYRSRARSAQAEKSLRVCEPERLLKDCCRRECAESKDFNYLK